MAQDGRLSRRIAGMLNARLPEAGLERVADPRSRRGRRWRLPRLLASVVTALCAGARSFREMELLTECLSPAVAKLLGQRSRVPDTSARDVIVRLEPDEVRRCIHRQVRAAHRRKALTPVGVPCGIVAIDGKYTAIPMWDDKYAQKQSHTTKEGASAHGVVRTLTCCLVSSSAKVCIDAVPIPVETNEMGHFPVAFDALQQAYGSADLFEIVTADAGFCSLANATHVHEQGKGYLFRLDASQQPTLYQEAARLLGAKTAQEAEAETTDWNHRTRTTRRLWTTTKMAAYLQWTHLQTVLRVQNEMERPDGTIVIEDRYFVTNERLARMKPPAWLAAVRAHWSVENHCHQTWDKMMREDDHPWLFHPRGLVVLALLRRVAYNALALFRTVTQRGEDQRATPWRELMSAVRSVLLGATEATLRGLRAREPTAEPA